MLYDPKWKETITPTEVPAIEPWRQILNEAIIVIQKRGWARGEFEHEGKVCAIGAFRVVQHGDPNKRRGRKCKYNPKDLGRAKRKLHSAIQNVSSMASIASFDDGGGITDTIMCWNDYCHRKEEILKVFKEAANAV